MGNLSVLDKLGQLLTLQRVHNLYLISPLSRSGSIKSPSHLNHGFKLAFTGFNHNFTVDCKRPTTLDSELIFKVMPCMIIYFFKVKYS